LRREENSMNKNSKALINNIYALRLIWNICPSHVIHKAILRGLGYFEWLFFSAFLVRYVIHSLEQEKSFPHMMIFVGITVAVFGSISLYNSYVDGKVIPITGVIINNTLGKKLFDKSTNVELSCYEDTKFYDQYTLAMEKADERLIETIDVIWRIVLGAIASVLSFGFLFQIDKIAILFVALPIIGNFVFNKVLSQIEFDRNIEMTPFNRRIAYINRVMYMADYAKEMRLTNVFSLMKQQYRSAIDGLVNTTHKYTRKAVIFHWLRVMFTFSFIFEGLLIYGAYKALVIQVISLAELAVITSMMVSSTWILIGFTQAIMTGFKNGLFLQNLRTFLEYEEKIPEDYDGEDPGNQIESIEFRNVKFSYGEDEVIRGLTFKIERDKTYALVGHNGAGKSTIIKLLMRFYDPSEGEILLNGKNIKTYHLRKYRALFATAFQDYQIFSLPVAENVLMRKAELEDEEMVVKALKLAGVYDKVLSLPNGIHTILTKEFDENGAVLSGGEYQKIVVARAFVKNSPFKIFDEPSSALDPIAEYQLFDSILKSGQNKTMVFISHRLSSVQNADWVFMLEDGKVIEEGTHHSLLMQQGSYANMYEKQAQNYLAVSHYDVKESILPTFKEVAE